MNNSETPTGVNGRKELKVTKSNEADKLLDKFFGDLREEGYATIDFRGAIFDVPKVAIKTKRQKETEQKVNTINVLSNQKRDYVLEEITNGLGINLKLADLEKVKAKTEKIRQEKADKANADTER